MFVLHCPGNVASLALLYLPIKACLVTRSKTFRRHEG